jgi:hypothetical protein
MPSGNAVRGLSSRFLYNAKNGLGSGKCSPSEPVAFLGRSRKTLSYSSARVSGGCQAASKARKEDIPKRRTIRRPAHVRHKPATTATSPAHANRKAISELVGGREIDVLRTPVAIPGCLGARPVKSASALAVQRSVSWRGMGEIGSYVSLNFVSVTGIDVHRAHAMANSEMQTNIANIEN